MSSVPPSDLERLFRRLVANLAALDPAAIHRPVAIREIHERIVPYRTHRLSLGLDTSEDYEMTLLRLCAGEEGWVTTFPLDAREAILKESKSVNPNTSAYRKFPAATLLLDPDRAAEVLAGRVNVARPPSPEPAPPSDDEEPVAPPHAAHPAEEVEGDESTLPFSLEEETEEERRVAQPREVAAITAPCPYCGAGLPVGRTVLFCPHCGQNIGVVHCPTCGSELDVGWQFCITCGQKVTGLG